MKLSIPMVSKAGLLCLLAVSVVQAFQSSPIMNFKRRSDDRYVTLLGDAENSEDYSSRLASSVFPDVDVSARDLRSIMVTDADGISVPLGNAMGSGTSVVVFLRHLGCTWCWSYVYQWNQIQKELAGENIEGPIFVSIGDKDRLNSFLESNPDVSRDKLFVDGYDFAAYKEAGFGRFDEKPYEVIGDVKPKPVQLGGPIGWWTFLTNFAALAPVTEDMKFPEMFTPEGLFWVGGTFVVRDNDIAYRWDDRISGDHPEVNDVVRIAKEVASQKSKPAFPDLFKIFSQS